MVDLYPIEDRRGGWGCGNYQEFWHLAPGVGAGAGATLVRVKVEGLWLVMVGYR